MLIEDLHVILKVAEFRNITAAAAHLDMSTATASVAIKRVEAALGTELFIRTTRKLRLSSAGERYIPQCEQALLMLEHAKQNMKSDLDVVDGELRIALPSDLGRNIVVPWLDEFMQAHPNVSLSLNISDRNLDFYRDPIDLALRYGSPKDANVYGFKICNVPRVVCAAPSYLEQHGTPEHPHDLASHQGLFYQLQDTLHNVWHFSQGAGSFKVKMSGRHASNDADLVRRWCVAGKGIAAKSSLDMSRDLLAGNVVSVLDEYQCAPTELWLIFPSRQSITPAARLLRDLLKEKTAEVLGQLVKRGILAPSALD